MLLLRPVKSLVNNDSSTALGLGCSSLSLLASIVSTLYSLKGFDEGTTNEEFKGLFSNRKS